jgi:hypothetical protein
VKMKDSSERPAGPKRTGLSDQTVI